MNLLLKSHNCILADKSGNTFDNKFIGGMS